MLSNLARRSVSHISICTTQTAKAQLAKPCRPVGFNRSRFFASEVPLYNRSAVDYESKYGDKLKQAAKKKGLTVEELKTKTFEEAKKRTQPAKAEKSAKKAPATSTEKTAASIKAKAQQPYESSAPTLDKIVKLELFEKEERDSIEKIWTQYHADKDCITAVIPREIYDKLYKRSQDYPMFIVPMPRETGIEFFVMQFDFHQCHFTSLLEYKTKGSEARPFFTITHFPELSDSKGIVLMRGEISDEPRMIDTQNAQFLAFTLQQFYATGSDDKLNLVKQFHKAPQNFDYQALIHEVEKMV
ncbi:ATP11-domain-containing protein [Hesseltinella vesiculosa]|uniref:ATP11-domain-containing protein n=1 Tax=Hesseltinella vesiculosa TaxID=101127 RepID=A0A1X2GNA5_9FUNG|nr:ATP11-domain-containing protein [Hesseltinella vesiculosa]